ncbi:hybrid sensor histidine kinase/response regulator [Hahella sp. KA22]|uniref:hybrid sensor histidine kinase/response regulator n=1 Tax=Hahella sp. KA22 TaxID=1628392 RepID=UPI0013E395DC|nr:hybrid sensor histidine kinase/response regulator [Hahella sp. KA22]
MRQEHKAKDSSRLGTAPEEFERAHLIESVKIRCQQTLPAVQGVFLIMAIFLFMLWDQAPLSRILLWVGPVAAAQVLRLQISRQIMRQLDSMTFQEIAHSDKRLLRSSLINQALVGTGIWTVGAVETDNVAFFMTLAISLYGVGAMVNLASDYRSFLLSIPLLMGQPILYWSLQGVDELRIAAPLATLTLLMISSVRRSSRTFAESVAMRFEKSALLNKVEAERKKAEEALAAAQEANKAKTYFMAAASHDLRQPLYAVSLLTDTLSYQPLGETAQEIVSKQRQAIEVLRTLFNNLLDLSRFEAGKFQPSMKALSLDEVMRPLEAEFQLLCQAKGLAWRCNYSRVCLYSDLELLSRLLNNLISNAIRYTHKGEVSVEAAVEGRRVAFTISDTGPGIERDDQVRIFEDFVQLNNPSRNREKGIGMGLAIVRRINEILDAGLTVQSSPGKGSRFSFYAPLAEYACIAPSLRDLEAPDNAFIDLNVWLVEDDPLVRSALSFQFDAWGCRYEIVANKDELLALRHRSQGWPDALILDDMLDKGEDGLDIADSLSQQMPKEKMLLVSGNVQPERVRELQESGFSFLTKPISSRQLQTWIESVSSH